MTPLTLTSKASVDSEKADVELSLSSTPALAPASEQDSLPPSLAYSYPPNPDSDPSSAPTGTSAPLRGILRHFRPRPRAGPSPPHQHAPSSLSSDHDEKYHDHETTSGSEKQHEDVGAKGDLAVGVHESTDVECSSPARRKRPLYRRKGCIACAGVVAALLVAGAIWAGVVEGLWGRYERRNAQAVLDLLWALYPFSISFSHPYIPSQRTPLIPEISSYLSDSNSSIAAAILSGSGGLGLEGGNVTLGAQRIWAHSHNDEMQEFPLSTALSQGFGSIEADVWLIDSTASPTLPDEVLWVGHENRDLRTNQTLWHVYVKPLLELLDKHNIDAGFLRSTGSNATSSSSNSTSTSYADRTIGADWVGLYPSDPHATVQLVIDIKNSPEDAYARLIRSLRPLRERGYLTTYNTLINTWKYGPLTVIGTGDTPLSAIYHSSSPASQNSTERYIFYDIPLLSITKPFSLPESQYGPAVHDEEWTSALGPMASGKFPLGFNAGALLPPPPSNVVLASLKWYADEAEKRGMRARWWGAARQPGWVRRRLWALMLEAGNAWVNADDLEDLRKYMARHPGKNA